MTRKSILLGSLVGSMLLAACSDGGAKSGADLMLLYQETEPGVDPYMTRVLVSKQFMRLDEGADQSNYTLYDRDKNIIYSVSHENRTIMEVRAKKSKHEISRKLLLDAKRLDSEEMPKIEGKQPVHYQLQVNSQSCAEVFVIKGMHEEARLAMSEFKRVLASIHLSNIDNTPVDMQDDCFLAHDVLSPSRTMQFGFPILERSADGVSRLLVDFDREFEAAAGLYQLPDQYRLINMDGSMVGSEAL